MDSIIYIKGREGNNMNRLLGREGKHREGKEGNGRKGMERKGTGWKGKERDEQE